MNPSEEILRLEGVKKKYGGFVALKGIDLVIKSGELFGFIGPNGAGKTTMIRIIVGIIKPTSGSVVISGLDLLRRPELAKFKVGYVPDRPYLYEKLTPLEHFEFIGGLYSVDAGTIQKIGEEMLNLFGLWEWRNELIESFSHGMKQKIAITSALLHDPDIFIVDEPMVGLDPKSVRFVKDFFKKWVQRGKSLFLTTHTLSVAQDMCSRIGIINHGEVIALGNMAELIDQSKNSSKDLESVFLTLTEEESRPSSPTE